MQFTFECELIGLSEPETTAIDDLMQRYCSAKRVAYNRLSEGESIDQVTHTLESLDSLSLNWRYCEHAARDAQSVLKSQRELLPLYLSDIYDRIEDMEKKIMRLREHKAKPTRLNAFEMRRSRLNKRKKELEDHLTRGTLPKVIFGSRSLFEERAKGKVTRERWRETRNDQLYSIGQANQKGNANARISAQGDKIGINFPHEIKARATRKGVIRVKNERRWLGLRVPDSFRKHLSTLIASGSAYSVRVVRRNGRRYFAHISLEIHNVKTTDGLPEKILSIDSNPKGYAATVVTKDGNLVAHHFFRDDRLIYASERKRDCVIGQFVGEMISYGRKNGAGAMVLEDLNITDHRNFGRRVNRVVYAFVRKKFFGNLLTRAWKEGCPVFTVNPAYTSRIGGVKYKERFGLSIHEAAAVCIGRRFFGHGERLEEPILVTVKRGRRKEKASVIYIWPSLYGYHRPSDPYMEPPGRKGGREERVDDGNGAVFTGRPASERTPLTKDEVVRKGGECGGSPQATGHGGAPAPPFYDGGGKVVATSERVK